MKILPNVKKYIQGILKDNKALPSSKSFKTVQSALEDHLLICKLVFFQSIVAEDEPFLTEFQSNKPMAPLLYESLSDILRNLMNRFVKPEILETSKYIHSIDNSENLQSAKKIDLGYATRVAISEIRAKVSDKNIHVFREQCRIYLKKIVEKLQIRSPLAYSLTKGSSCFDPTIATSPAVRDSRLRLASNDFVKKKRQISGTTADKIEKQFKLLCAKPRFLDEMNGFSRQRDRLDDLWVSVLEDFMETSQEM